MPASPTSRRFGQIFQELWPDALASAGEGFLHATGPCMLPTIAPGDRVRVEKPSASDYRVGDVVVYRGESSLVAHRVVGAFSAGRDRYLVHRGDNSHVRGVLPLSSVLGRVTLVADPSGKERPVPSVPPSALARAYYSWTAAIRHVLHDVRAALTSS